MSFFFGGKDSAVPVLVKHIERLLRGGRLSDTDDDGFVLVVVVVVACCDWCKFEPISAGTNGSCCAAGRGGGDGITGCANSAAERNVAYLGGSS